MLQLKEEWQDIIYCNLKRKFREESNTGGKKIHTHKEVCYSDPTWKCFISFAKTLDQKVWGGRLITADF